MQTSHASYVLNNFTENCWGLTRAPDDLVEELRRAVRKNLASAVKERTVEVIEGAEPKFIHQGILMRKVLKKLRSMHEEWAGVPLIGNNAYGFRLYQNQSFLNMHVDKPETHVISCILHVDRSEDAEPWPIVIEDLQGNTNEVYLTPGDLLFYESAKCLHGRPKIFTGSWYTSVFVHYYPQGWDRHRRMDEARIAVPLHWSKHHAPPYDDDDITATCATDDIGNTDDELSSSSSSKQCVKKELERLQMVGTGMKEPECPDNWCALAQSVKWHGPASKDVVISTGDKH